MNKSLIIEEVSRMRTLMGLSNKNVMNLLKEDTGSVIQKFFTELSQAIGKGDDVLATKIINDFRTTNPNEAKIFDEWMGGSKAMKYGNDVIYTLADLAKLGSVKAFAAFTETIAKNSDSFLATLAKNVSSLKLLPLPSGINPSTLMDGIIGLDGVPEFIKQYLRDVKSGNLGKYSAQEIKGLNASLIRASQDATGGMTAAQKKAVGQFVGELEEVAKEVEEAEIKITGGKRKTSSWSPTDEAEYIDFEDISDEIGFDAGTAGRETGGEAGTAGREGGEAGGEAGTAGREGGEAGTAGREGGEAGTAGREGDELDDFWRRVEDEETAGETESIVELTTRELQDKYRQMYIESKTEFRLALDELRGRIKKLKKGDKLTKDDIALLDIAGENGLIKQNDPIFTFMNKNILRDPTVSEIQDLVKMHNAWKKSGGKTTFDEYCRLKGYTPPGWFKRNVAAKGMNVVDGYLGAWQRTISRIDPETGKAVTWGQFAKDLGVVLSTVLFLTGTAISVFTDLDDVILQQLYKADPMQKQQITKNLTEYFGYTSPILIVDGKQFNIYDPKLGKDNPNFVYRSQAPNPDFTLGNVDKLEFGLEPGLFVSGRTFNIFRLNPQNEKLIGGSEILGKAHTLTALDTGAQGVSTSTTVTGNPKGTKPKFEASNFGQGKTVTSFTYKGNVNNKEQYDVTFYSNTDPDKTPVSRTYYFNGTNWSKN